MSKLENMLGARRAAPFSNGNEYICMLWEVGYSIPFPLI
jgi:hypothetical protein